MPLCSLHCTKFTTIARADAKLWRHIILGSKWPDCPEWDFFPKNHWYDFDVPFVIFDCAKSFQQNQSSKHVQSLGPKWLNCSKEYFFGKFNNIIFIYLLAPFIVQNFKKSLQRIKSSEGASFLGLIWWACFTKNFFRKTISIILIESLCPFHCAILKNCSMWSRVMMVRHFWTQNGLIARNHFFWQTMNVPLIWMLYFLFDFG